MPRTDDRPQFHTLPGLSILSRWRESPASKRPAVDARMPKARIPLVMNSSSNQTPPETRLAQLQLELPPAPQPAAVYRPMVVVNSMAYVSGHGPLKPDKTLIKGRVGADLDLDAG